MYNSFQPNYTPAYYGRPQTAQPMQAVPQMQPMQQSGGMIWVGSEAEAYAYMVAPNTAVALWDSNRPAIYLKQADAAGKPTVKTFDLVERTEPIAQPVPSAAPVAIDPGEFVTRKEFDELIKRLAAMTVKEDVNDE